MNKRIALKIMFLLLGALLIFHVLIFTEQIPYDKVWAGKLNSVEEMKAFEAFSILINLFMILILSIKYKLLESGKSNKAIDILIWVFVVFFALNTVGNMFAKSLIELILGGILTLVSSILCFIIVKKEKIIRPQ
ncbi:hypothetical protein [Arenibacter palladensis]|uniref:hypothetical protein n=1 Tax=Arenibacter palladensis TaxID=237373 RepID=UPI0026E26D71|nr:hypothetical protein [Arenibacter palladensis]MDO6602573.1 hypothetical protein [Arenibacter palladensis]|tara:strand:+ start:1375 stop:1776 length:402 start_codon:yes stop_codon:yes gene_type:complete